MGRRWGRVDASGCDSARSGGTCEFEVAEAEPGRRIAWKSVHGVPFDLTVHAGPRAHWPSVDQGDVRGGHPTARRCGGCCRRWWRWRPRPGRRANSRGSRHRSRRPRPWRRRCHDDVEPTSRSAPGRQLAISSGRAAGTRNGSDSSPSTRTRVASGIASPARPGCTCTPRRQPGPPRTRSRAGRSRTSSR